MPPKIINFLGSLVVVLLLLMGLGSLVLHTINKVRTGHGLDRYFTGWGVEMNYIGALIAVAVAALALLIGLIVRFWSKIKR